VRGRERHGVGGGKELYWELYPCVEEDGEGGKQTQKERERERERNRPRAVLGTMSLRRGSWRGRETDRERERETDRELYWEQCPHVEEDGEGGKQTQKERERERERERETCMVTCIGNNVSL